MLVTAEHHSDLLSCKFGKCHSFINTTLKHVVDSRQIPRGGGGTGRTLCLLCTQACNYLAASPRGLSHSCHTHIVLLMSMWIFWLHSAAYNYMRACVCVHVRKFSALWVLTLRSMDTFLLSTRSGNSFLNFGSWLSSTASKFTLNRAIIRPRKQLVRPIGTLLMMKKSFLGLWIIYACIDRFILKRVSLSPISDHTSEFFPTISWSCTHRLWLCTG